jgi:hypothetical protein
MQILAARGCHGDAGGRLLERDAEDVTEHRQLPEGLSERHW